MKKRPRDTNQLAKLVTMIAVGEAEEMALDKRKNPAAIALGRRGGIKGGKVRAEQLTPEQRKAIARKGAAKRWKK